MKYIYGNNSSETKQLTEEYMNAIKNGEHIYPRIYCTLIGQQYTTELGEEDIALDGGITFSTYLNPDNDYKFGTSSSTECVIYFLKNSKTEQIDWTQSIRLYFGVNIGGNIKYQNMGMYFGSDPNIIKSNGYDVFVFTGYDTVSLLGGIKADAMISTLSFPSRIGDIYNAISTYLFDNYSIYFDEHQGISSVMVNSNPFDFGMTIKSVLELISESQGTYLCGGQRMTGKSIKTVRMQVPLYSIDCTFTPDDYFEFNKPIIEIPSLPALQYTNTNNPSKNESYPSTYTGTPYYITNNKIFDNISSQDKSDLISILYRYRLMYGSNNTPHCYPMNIKAICNYLVEAGDIVNVEDENGNTYPLWVFSCIIKWNGGAEAYYECTGNLNREQQLPEDKVTANCEKKVLLWQNDSPSTFNAQTLNIDFTGYDGFEVYTQHGHGKQMFFAQKFIVTYFAQGLGNSSFYTCARSFTVADDRQSVAVSNCGYTYRDGGAGVNNGLHVPMLIYGIKLG